MLEALSEAVLRRSWPCHPSLVDVAEISCVLHILLRIWVPGTPQNIASLLFLDFRGAFLGHSV
jgi:hypothetical protein